MRQPRRRIVQAIVWSLAPVALLAVLRPWTVRPIEGSAPSVFEADAFAISAWSRLVREAEAHAVDLAALPVSPGGEPPQARFVKGTGTVVAIDRQSRAGVLRVRLTGARPTTVAVQIGPVVRGTALRDAASFIQFSDFTNQFDYAGAANALNDYALRHVIGPLAVDGLEGRTILFTGATGKQAPRDGEPLEVVPVQVEIVGDATR